MITALESKPRTHADHSAFLRKAGAALSTPPDSVSTHASTWAAEVGVLPARTLFELPLSPALAFEVPGLEGVVRISVDSEHEGTEGDVWFDLDEWRALVIATEADRLWPDDLVNLCRRKKAQPSFRVELVHALDGGQPDPSEQWSLSRVLTRWGVERLSVDLVS